MEIHREMAIKPGDEDYNAFIDTLDTFVEQQEFTDAEVKKVKKFIENNREFLFSDVLTPEVLTNRSALAEKLERLSEKIYHQPDSGSIFSRVTVYFKNLVSHLFQKQASRKECSDTLRHFVETIRRPPLPAEIWGQIIEQTMPKRELSDVVGKEGFSYPELSNTALISNEFYALAGNKMKRAINEQHISLKALGFSLQEAVKFAIENDLSSVNLIGYDVKDKEIEALTEGLTDLRHIYLWGGGIDDQIIVKLTEKFPDLETLALSGFKNFTTSMVDQIAIHLNDLRHLFINETDVSDDQINTLTQKFSGLETLDVSGCNKLTDRGFDAVAINVKDLRHLFLRNTRGVRDSSINALAQKFSHLETLDIYNSMALTDNGIREILEKLKQLRSLSLGDEFGLDVITPETLASVAKNMPNLKKLDIKGVSPYSVNDKTLNLLAESLTNLHVFSCRADGKNRGLVRFLKNNSDLKVLNLVLLDPGVTEDLNKLVAEIARLPMRLKAFDLSMNNDHIDLDAIAEIAKRQPELQSLNLRDCEMEKMRRVELDKALLLISYNLKELQHLDIGKSDTSISNVLGRVLRRLPKLKSFYCGTGMYEGDQLEKLK